MDEKLNGIVLGGVNFGENDKILKIFTLEKGAVSAKIKGVKKSGAKLKFASEPFCFAEFIFSKKGDMRTVTGASLIDSFYPLREDIVRFFAAGTVVEFVKRFAKENLVSSQMFLLTVDALKKIAYGEDSPRSVLAEFLLSALKIVGYGLTLDGCTKCGKMPAAKIYFDGFSGEFFCEQCKEPTAREINLSTLLYLQKLDTGEKLCDFEAVRVLRLLDFYLIMKTDEKINSLKELLQLPVDEPKD